MTLITNLPINTLAEDDDLLVFASTTSNTFYKLTFLSLKTILTSQLEADLLALEQKYTNSNYATQVASVTKSLKKKGKKNEE